MTLSIRIRLRKCVSILAHQVSILALVTAKRSRGAAIVTTKRLGKGLGAGEPRPQGDGGDAGIGIAELPGRPLHPQPATHLAGGLPHHGGEHPVKVIEGETGAARQLLDGEIRLLLQCPQHGSQALAIVDHERTLAI
ncbi:hypothetical protein D3C76_1200830 [compost metagenome]